MDKKIVDFINEHHLLTLATTKDNVPYCCNAFYVFNEETNSLFFSSDTKTKHAQDFIANPKVAGSISLETKAVGKIQGVQLLGEIVELKNEALKKASKQYLKAYPYARLMETHLWEMQLTFAKMTHNLLGFGKKLIWEK
ncbi:MAG: pyridoxamine 5'-phosphate oxidase family protein [Flavobacteriales bacterium]|nr:pyridoxamine 5'-phosphate oxidase family protein [Flavobacteriales bacterium]